MHKILLCRRNPALQECPHRESNLDLGFRKPLFYPLNYEDIIP